MLPPGAVSLVNEDWSGSHLALCAQTGEPAIKRGARTIAQTAVWAGDASAVHKLAAGPGACDPAWSPDGEAIAFVRNGDICTATKAATSLRRLTATRAPVSAGGRPS